MNIRVGAVLRHPSDCYPCKRLAADAGAELRKEIRAGHDTHAVARQAERDDLAPGDGFDHFAYAFRLDLEV